MSSVDIGALLQKQKSPTYIMVEIGYGLDSIVRNFDVPFIGDRIYIGVENGMRGGFEGAQHRARRAEKRFEGQNVTFIVQDAQGFPRLPDGFAHEIFAGNVFCDPMVAANQHMIRTLLSDISRMALPDCTIVLRETITPYEAHPHLRDFIAAEGLGVAAYIDKRDSEWEVLERMYGRHDLERGMKTHSRSYYLFLHKL